MALHHFDEKRKNSFTIERLLDFHTT